MTVVFFASALFITSFSLASVQSSNSATCPTTEAVGDLLRTRVLARWSTITPEVLSESWPGPLRQIASGSSTVRAHVEKSCAIYFTFVPNPAGPGFRLRGVRIVREDGREEAFERARMLASTLGPTLTPEEERELRTDLSVTTSWRVPSALELPGTLFIRAIDIVQNPRDVDIEAHLWQLEVTYERLDDVPFKGRR